MTSVPVRDPSASISRQAIPGDELGWSRSIPLSIRTAVDGAFFHLKRYVLGLQWMLILLAAGSLFSSFQQPRPVRHWLLVIVTVLLIAASARMLFRILQSARAGDLAVLDARPPRANLIVLGIGGAAFLYESVERFLAGGPSWWLAGAACSLLLMVTCFHGCRFVSLANRVLRLLDAEEDRRQQSEESREPGAGSREPGAGSREPGAGSRERTVTAPPRPQCHE